MLPYIQMMVKTTKKVKKASKKNELKNEQKKQTIFFVIFLAVNHFFAMCEEDFFLLENPKSETQEKGAWQLLYAPYNP